MPLIGGDVARIPPAAQGAPIDAPIRAEPPVDRSLTLLLGRLARNAPIVLLAVTLPTGGCYLSHERPSDAGHDAGIDSAVPDSGPPPDFGPPPVCGFDEERFTVEIPPPGVPADASLLCVEPDPAISNEAARVTLVLDAGDPTVAHATIAIDPGLAGTVVGLPAVDISERGFDIWPSAVVGPVSADGATYAFDVTWPFPLADREPGRFDNRAVFDVRFELACDDGSTKRVIATTVVHVCIEDDRSLSFASSGDECRACAIIAEMAPTPIIPANRPDALPLQQGMLLSLRPLALFDNAVVLLAEHGEGDEGVRYDWHATAGRLTAVDRDVVVWEPPHDDGVHAVQVVVETNDAAAIATWRRGGGL